MSVPVPLYLRDLAVVEKQRKTWTLFSLRCPCGCGKFFVYENYLTKEEKELAKPHNDAWARLMREGFTCKMGDDGVCHHWITKNTEDGKAEKGEEVYIPDAPFFVGITVFRITCAECGKEYLLFDSRKCGYDAMTAECDKEKADYVPNFRLKYRDAVSLSVKVENDESLEAFKENTGLDFTEDQYSDSFSWMAVYKMNDNGKKTKIIDYETA